MEAEDAIIAARKDILPVTVAVAPATWVVAAAMEYATTAVRRDTWQETADVDPWVEGQAVVALIVASRATWLGTVPRAEAEVEGMETDTEEVEVGMAVAAVGAIIVGDWGTWPGIVLVVVAAAEEVMVGGLAAAAVVAEETAITVESQDTLRESVLPTGLEEKK